MIDWPVSARDHSHGSEGPGARYHEWIRSRSRCVRTREAALRVQAMVASESYDEWLQAATALDEIQVHTPPQRPWP